MLADKQEATIPTHVMGSRDIPAVRSATHPAVRTGCRQLRWPAVARVTSITSWQVISHPAR